MASLPTRYLSYSAVGLSRINTDCLRRWPIWTGVHSIIPGTQRTHLHGIICQVGALQHATCVRHIEDIVQLKLHGNVSGLVTEVAFVRFHHEFLQRRLGTTKAWYNMNKGPSRLVPTRFLQG